jgi:hypothetical protein
VHAIASPAVSPAPVVRTCASRVESGLFVRGIPASYRKSVIVAGPLLLIARFYAKESPSTFRPVPGRPGRYYAQKLLVAVRAGSVVTLSVPHGERRIALLYSPKDWRIPYSRGYRLTDGERKVTFHACRASEPSFVPRKRRTVGRWTEFNGAFVVAGAHCAKLLVHARGYRRTIRVSFGAGACG